MNPQNRVAYFSPEIAIDDSLHLYAGGQGVVAGAIARAAVGLPLSIVSILWRCGFCEQGIGPNGMTIDYMPRYYKEFLQDTGAKVKVQIGDNPNTLVKVWRLPPEVFRTVPIILLDTDIEENDHLSRTITQAIYGGGAERRLAQRIVLGIGGVKALQALGISVDLYHLNEGETALASIELLRQKMAEGLGFQNALNWTQEHVVSTIHTPELAGNTSYPVDLMMWLGCLLNLNYQQAVFLGGQPFNSTVSLLKTSKKANAVSELHCETANQTFSGIEGKCDIIPISNGVVDDWWQPPGFRGDKTAEEIRRAKLPYKRVAFELVKTRAGKTFREDVLTIIWGRRDAEYKRQGLIFGCKPSFEEDKPPVVVFYEKIRIWLENILKSGRVQVILAGKPHPDDWPMINLWNHIWRISQELPNIAVLAGYELDMMRLLKIAADVWLCTPRRPQEACSTSGMTASAVGALPVSTIDGWVAKGIRSGENGFLYGVAHSYENKGEQDVLDAEDLMRCLEVEVMPTFYNNKPKWDSMVLAAKKEVEQNYSAKRMMGDYGIQFYGWG